MFCFVFSSARIKTNGSLPRNETKRSVQSPSVGRHLNSSEDELTGIFTFETSALTTEKTPTPSAAAATATADQDQRQSLGDAAKNNCKSPYENVTAPHSPRTRIRTQLVKNGRDEADKSPAAAVVAAAAAAGLPVEHTYQLITSGVAAEVSLCRTLIYQKLIKVTAFHHRETGDPSSC